MLLAMLIAAFLLGVVAGVALSFLILLIIGWIVGPEDGILDTEYVDGSNQEDAGL